MGFVKLPTPRFGSYHVATERASGGRADTASRYFQDERRTKPNSGKVLGLLGGSFLGREQRHHRHRRRQSALPETTVLVRPR